MEKLTSAQKGALIRAFKKRYRYATYMLTTYKNGLSETSKEWWIREANLCVDELAKYGHYFVKINIDRS